MESSAINIEHIMANPNKRMAFTSDPASILGI
jgi:hypothetical protein